MQPYDGSGYGISMYWRNQMKDIATQTSETCPCWLKTEPLIKFNGEKQFTITVKCKEKRETCQTAFNETETELMKRFKTFYKV